MASIRSSFWSIIGLSATSTSISADKCLPIDMLMNLDSAKSLSNEIAVAERNVAAFKDRISEFASAFSMTLNDLLQLASYSVASNPRFGEALIAKAAELHKHASTTLQHELSNRVLEPLIKWRVSVNELIVRLEEQRRMHHQQELLRHHIRAREEGRVRQMKTGRWSVKDGVELRRAQDAFVSWKLKTEAVDSVVTECVQRDLIEAKQQNGLHLLKEFDSIDEKFWSFGYETCKLRKEMLGALASHAGEPSLTTTEKKKRKSKKHAAKTADKGEKPGDNHVVVDSAIPDILSSFECLRFGSDPFTPSDDSAQISPMLSKGNEASPIESCPGDPFQNFSCFELNK